MTNRSSFPGDPPDVPDPHPLVEKVCHLLEMADVDQKIIDEVEREIENLVTQAYAICPICEARALEEEMKTWNLVKRPRD